MNMVINVKPTNAGKTMLESYHPPVTIFIGGMVTYHSQSFWWFICNLPT
jgi:hypothetical protein